MKLVAIRVLSAFALLPLRGLAAESTLHPKPASTPGDLFQAVAAQDRALFDAYNHCDLKSFASFFAEDVEFYHDKGGITRGREALTQSIRDNICGRVKRELVADTLQVYPMDNYGALELGTHRFHHPNESHDQVGEGKFVHLWQYDKKTRSWKVTRVVSFDHHTVAP